MTTAIITWTLVVSLVGDTFPVVIPGYPSYAACQAAGQQAGFRGKFYCVETYKP